MKRSLILLLSAILIVSLLAACSSVTDVLDRVAAPESDSNAVVTEAPPTEPPAIPTDPPTEPPTIAPVTHLEDVYKIDSYSYNLKTGGFTDAFGNSDYDAVHYYMSLNESHWLDKEPYSLHYLNGQYTTFSGTIVVPAQDSIDAKFYVHIFADGTQIYSVNDVSKTGGAVDFTLNVSGCEQLEIRTGETTRVGNGYSDGCNLGIVNTLLE